MAGAAGVDDEPRGGQPDYEGLQAYAAFLLTRMQKGVQLSGVRAAESEETEFSVKELAGDIGRSCSGCRHIFRL